MTFEKAVAMLPNCMVGHLDLLGQHHTIADLDFMVQHELDLHEEGEIGLSSKTLQSLKRYREIISPFIISNIP